MSQKIGFTTNVNQEVLTWLDKIAEQHGTTRSEIVRKFIRTAQLDKSFLQKSLERL